MLPLISLKNISKSFGIVKALRSIQLEVQPGEILALVGENGAGKSTLMKILSGVYPVGEFEGVIEVRNQPVSFRSPRDSEAQGIALIHQELSTFPQLSVAENMMVGHWPTQKGLVDHRSLQKKAEHWLKILAADFSPMQKMSTLSPGQQQVVEIGKALSRNSKILILDEPTSSLTHRETKKLFSLLQDLRKQGCALIYISHRMEEIFYLADRVVVLRDGQNVFTSEVKGLKQADLIRAMVGRELEQAFQPQISSASSNIILEVEDFCAHHLASAKKYGPLHFSLAQGEILGFSGLLGAGRSEILQALCGDEAYTTSGEVKFKKSKKAFGKLQKAYRQGFGLVPEDRKVQSILPTRSLSENTSVVRLAQKSLFSWVSKSIEKSRTEKDLKVLRTRFHSTEQTITELSGGNQQKVIFARVMQNSPEILILDEPTRGVDVGAKFEIYQLARQWAQEGKAIILISSDLPELMALSDRILVMAGGRIQGQLLKSEFQEEAIIKLAIQADSKVEKI
ncbi:MAG: sugar ABC transporter ATP-binding protein [Bdellovibrionaceae bacterium]|nr:sugar ABC transporter ATP-binding protein [Bdellovibrio sp.]